MIVPMKKIFLLLLNSDKNDSLKKLKDLGVVHLEDIKGSGEKLSSLQNKRDLVSKSLSGLPNIKKKGSKKVSYGKEETLEITKRIIRLNEELKTINEDILNTNKEIDRIKVWGDFNPEDFSLLKSNGVSIKLYKLKKSDIKELPENIKKFSIANVKSVGYYAIISNSFEEMQKFEEVILPQIGLDELYTLLESKNQSKDKISKELENLANAKSSLENLLSVFEDEIEFENIYSGLSVDGSLTYLQGFIPAGKADLIKNGAITNSWAVMLQEPDETDLVPTLIENSKVVRIIQPVFDFLGTIPGYREKDISFFFLIFFSIFFAMIIGDGGYGAIFLGISIFAGFKIKKKTGSVPDGVKLLAEMSVLTIIWGAITGTWFGSIGLSKIPFLNMFIIDKITSFSDKPNAQYIKHLTFIIGTVHLSIAHIWNFISMLKKKPLIKAFSQLGWLSMVLGLYFLVLNFVLSAEEFPMPSVAVYMIFAGLIAVILFSEQEGNFFKGLLKGVAGLMPTFLDSISAFSDIISYIRLFAVGLATVAVASSFNSMAANMGTGVVGIIGSILILGLGHALNLAMAALSVVVHGVRLNVLEFSGHLGMEWTGDNYIPFKNKIDK
ncbi:MAG: V-type ATP synthase subunit I [Spirochaetia bacterium]|jgi:V/A-type H+-transporting ATPase subunit I|nr:V-type ATP synthase subunit I [Spirochaetia bacterium]